MGKYAKFFVAAAGAVSAALSAYFGNVHWVTALISALTALTVYIVPNVNQ